MTGLEKEVQRGQVKRVRELENIYKEGEVVLLARSDSGRKETGYLTAMEIRE